MLLAMDCKNYLISGLLAGVISLILLETTFSQYPGIDDDIEKYRKTGVRIITRPGAKVTVEQINHDFWFGCAISNIIASSGMPQKEKALYKEKFLENFNSAVTENAVKWPGMEPRKGLVNYATVDSILLWTEKNNIPLRAHNLFWGIEKFIQPWVKELGDDELRETLRKRAETVTSHYRGRFAEYDLNNEMIHGNYYEKRLGPQITSLMAQWAHNGDPDVQLYLNDYDILTGRMLPEYMSQIRTLLKQGVPVAGIGAQGHLHAETFDRVMLRKALDSLATFKLPVKITEFNIPGQRSKYYEKPTLKMTPQEEESAARELVDYYKICFAHPSVEGILMWGFWEGANWIPQSSMYRRDWTITPLGQAYKNLVFKELWTNISGTADSKGVFTAKVFYGRHRITVDGISKEVNIKKSSGNSVTVEIK